MIKKTFGGYGRTIDTSKFRELADAWAKRPQGDPRRSLIERAEREARAISRDFEKNKKIISDAVRPQIDPVALGEAIVRAGARRRGEVPTEDQLTDLKPNTADTPAVATAKLVLLAGQRRRGELAMRAVDEDDESERDDVDDEGDTGDDDDEGDKAKELAKKIIEAGKKRRNDKD
jgi:hypothetical protein